MRRLLNRSNGYTTLPEDILNWTVCSPVEGSKHLADQTGSLRLTLIILVREVFRGQIRLFSCVRGIHYITERFRKVVISL